MRREVDALVDDGWRVSVVSPKYLSDPFYREHPGGVHSYHYPKPDGGGALGHILEHSLTLLLGSAYVFWIYLRHGFRVFHACNPMDTLWMIGAPYKLMGVRLIFDQHDLCPELFLSRRDGSTASTFYPVLKWLERKAYRTAHVVIATNESYRDVAAERGGKPEDDIFVVRNGPDLGRFRAVPPRTDLKEEGERLFGYLGNMNEQDGVDYLLAAAAIVQDRLGRKDIRFVLVGGGSAQPRMARLAAERRLGNVRFTGRIPDDEMLATLSACDACIQPDPSNPLNDKSTMNKVLEYMALGKPVIAFDLPETRVSGGDAAIYVPPNDVAAMAQAIVELADDAPRRKQMGRMGRERIESRLSWDYSVPHLIAAYERALHGAVRSSARERRGVGEI